MTHKIALALFWALLAFIVFSTLSPLHLRPHLSRASVERAGAFFALAVALGTGYPRRLLLVALVICSIAAGSEAFQLLVPTRHARLLDGLEKTAGGLAGVAVVAAVILARRSRHDGAADTAGPAS